MSENEASASPEIHGPRPWLVLGALVLGLILGILSAHWTDPLRSGATATASIVGGLWLKALEMTVVPLIIGLLVTGIAQSAEAARGGRIAGRAVLWIVILSTASAVIGTALILLFLRLVPLSASSVQALRSAIASAQPIHAQAASGSVAGFFKDLVPENIVSAAANSDILPLVVATLLFALAVSRIAPRRRASLVDFFAGITDAFLVIIGWVLMLAPVGVLALAFGLGAAAGGAAFAALVHYIILVSAVGLVITIAAYPVAVVGGRVPLARFSRALLPPQGIAISTRSSLACLPAMLTSARQIGLRDDVVDVTLPIAVALFRATGPAMNVAVAIYVAYAVGLHPGPGAIVAATLVGAVMSYPAISLPGEISYISSIAPIALALGAPIAPLALLVAVEMIPDIIRTLGNVCADVAVTAVVNRTGKLNAG
ncbi:MAG TPA: cation:dicarboxylase symporter family transporter [Sphingomicrobium sp.]|nr:cation:dicarboxylase symporter family transporter [Sphingomicrobium sp.]